MMSPYFEQKVMNAEPVELVRLLHQKAIACVKEALEHLRHRRIAERARVIGDAYACLDELLGSLKPEEAPELAGRLQSLYLYMQRLLLEANRAQKEEPLIEVLALLTTLAEGWAGVAAQATAGREARAVWEKDSPAGWSYREVLTA